jgi:hypothetical protein
LAQEIIVGQQQEIVVMRQQLPAAKPAAAQPMPMNMKMNEGQMK